MLEVLPVMRVIVPAEVTAWKPDGPSSAGMRPTKLGFGKKGEGRKCMLDKRLIVLTAPHVIP